MKLRVAWKVFKRGTTGDLQRARGPVWRAWNRERARFTRMRYAGAVRVPRLLRKLRGSKGSEILWPEIVLFAVPDCKSCGGFGLQNLQYCSCALGAFADGFAGRYYPHPKTHRLHWRTGQAPGNCQVHGYFLDSWVSSWAESMRIVRVKTERIRAARVSGDPQMYGSAVGGHTVDIQEHLDKAMRARANLIRARLDRAFTAGNASPWALLFPTSFRPQS